MEKIQIGLDLATSITILIAVCSFWYNRIKEREIGVADSARSTIIENINSSITKMAKSFNAFVRLTTSIEKKIDFHLSKSSEHLEEAIKSKKVDPEEILKLFSDSSNLMGDFYEDGEMLKYTIYPSLYSIGNEDEAVEIIKKEIRDVMLSYNESNSSHASYLSSVLALHSAIKQHQAEHGEGITNELLVECMGKLTRIVDDKDHYLFLQAFIDNGDDEKFKESITKATDEMTEEEKRIRVELLDTFFRFMVNKPEKIIGHALEVISFKLQENRTQCKEFLITLSAVSSKMQQRSSNFSIKKAYSDLSSEQYFDTSKTIR